MKQFIALLLAFLLLPWEVFGSDPLDQTRLMYGGTWEGYCGVQGGIPPVSVVYTNFSTNATSGQINAAALTCPSNQCITFDAGLFSALTTNLWLKSDGVVFRGATNSSGVPTTIFPGVSIVFGPPDGWDFSSSSAWTTNRVTAGVTRGSTTMTITSVTGLTVGRVVYLFAPGSATVTGGNWSDLFGNYPGATANRVTAINGNDVTFERPFDPDFWPATIGIAWKGAGSYNYRVGLENLMMQPLNTNTAGYGNSYITTQGTVESWIENVYTKDLASQNTHHIYVYGSYRLEIRHCDWYRMRTAEGAGDSSNNYCVLLAHSHGFSVEDNVAHRVPNVMPMFECSDGVFAYNFWYDAPYGANNPSWLSQGTFTHGSHNMYILEEGNWQPASYNESGTSGSRNLTFFRGRHRGYDENPTQGVPKNADNIAICLGDGHFKATIAGCVLGDTNQHTVYRDASNIAGNSGSDNFPTVCLHLHTNITNTINLIGNYNVVSVGVPVTEALAGGQALVTSYCHSNKPAWFGNRPWPLVDPANYIQSNQRTNWPGGIRFATGLDTPQDAGGATVGTNVAGRTSGNIRTTGKIRRQ